VPGDGGRIIRAAGGVLWRLPPGGAVEVALVHRPRYDDWSLPKGKIRRGEQPLVTACREVAEETGIRAIAGKRLDIAHYDTTLGSKAVEFWAMHGRTAHSPLPRRWTAWHGCRCQTPDGGCATGATPT